MKLFYASNTVLLKKYTFEDLRLIASFQLAMQEISGFLKSFDADAAQIKTKVMQRVLSF